MNVVSDATPSIEAPHLSQRQETYRGYFQSRFHTVAFLLPTQKTVKTRKGISTAVCNNFSNAQSSPRQVILGCEAIAATSGSR